MIERWTVSVPAGTHHVCGSCEVCIFCDKYVPVERLDIPCLGDGGRDE